DVVGARDVVAEGGARIPPHEETPGLSHETAQRLRLLADQLEVLGRDGVGQPYRSLGVPCLYRREGCVRDGLERARDELHAAEHTAQDVLVRRDHAAEAGRAVLRLPAQAP